VLFSVLEIATPQERARLSKDQFPCFFREKIISLATVFCVVLHLPAGHFDFGVPIV